MSILLRQARSRLTYSSSLSLNNRSITSTPLLLINSNTSPTSSKTTIAPPSHVDDKTFQPIPPSSSSTASTLDHLSNIPAFPWYHSQVPVLPLPPSPPANRTIFSFITDYISTQTSYFVLKTTVKLSTLTMDERRAQDSGEPQVFEYLNVELPGFVRRVFSEVVAPIVFTRSMTESESESESVIDTLLLNKYIEAHKAINEMSTNKARVYNKIEGITACSIRDVRAIVGLSREEALNIAPIDVNSFTNYLGIKYYQPFSPASLEEGRQPEVQWYSRDKSVVNVQVDLLLVTSGEEFGYYSVDEEMIVEKYESEEGGGEGEEGEGEEGESVKRVSDVISTIQYLPSTQHVVTIEAEFTSRKDKSTGGKPVYGDFRWKVVDVDGLLDGNRFC